MAAAPPRSPIAFHRRPGQLIKIVLIDERIRAVRSAFDAAANKRMRSFGAAFQGARDDAFGFACRHRGGVVLARLGLRLQRPFRQSRLAFRRRFGAVARPDDPDQHHSREPRRRAAGVSAGRPDRRLQHEFGDDGTALARSWGLHHQEENRHRRRRRRHPRYRLLGGRVGQASRVRRQSRRCGLRRPFHCRRADRRAST